MLVPCTLCSDKSIDNAAGLHLHHTINHANSSFVCGFCLRSYGNKWSSLRKHLIDKHSVPSQPGDSFDCAVNEKASNCRQPYLVTHENQTSSENITSVFGSESVEALSSFIQNEFPDDLVPVVLHEADVLISKLNSRMGLPRSLVSSLIDDFSSFFSSGFLERFKNLVLNIMQSANIPESDREKVSSIFGTLLSPFRHLSTEHLRMKHFEKLGDYIPPESYVIERRPESVSTENGTEIQMKDVTGQKISLRKVLAKFFELPHVLEDINAYRIRLSLDSEILSDLTQCEGWKRKLQHFPRDAFVLPLFGYFDDFEPNAALGPHSEKLGCCYVSLPFLPPECQSKLENIFLALLFNADDRRTYGNEKTFKPFIEELNFLEKEGIFVRNINGSLQRIYFATAAVLGDNLGLNSMCGFVESFSATYFCRRCKVTKHQSESMCTEDVTLLRTEENYAADVEVNNFQETGVKENCIFNALDSVQIPEDIGVDPFHDLNEGVCHYTMISVLKHFHSLSPFFLENLNDRMYYFSYGIDSDNKPPSILPEHLEKNKLKMTGADAEMLIFVLLFGVFVGDLVSEDDPFWRLYLLLQDIVTICNSKRLPKDIGKILEVLVKDHHELYCSLTGLKLKPKHHFLLHYNSRLLYLFGPFALLSTIRFEARHKLLKFVANVCFSRRNLPLTVAIKQQLALCYRFVSKKSIRPEFIIGSGQSLNLKVYEQFPAFSLTMPDDIFANSENQFGANWVDFYGSKFKRGMVFLTGVDESRCPTFAKIEIILLHNNEPLFICSPFETLGLDSHIKGYEVKEISNQLNWFCISHSELVDELPHSIRTTADGETVIVPKHLLLV